MIDESNAEQLVLDDRIRQFFVAIRPITGLTYRQHIKRAIERYAQELAWQLAPVLEAQAREDERQRVTSKHPAATTRKRR